MLRDEQPRVVVVGSVNQDHIVTMRRFPRPGETVTASRYDLAGGGKGANQAVAAAAAGARTLLVGAVGADEAGTAALRELAESGVDCAYVERMAAHATGTAIVMLDEAGDNRIIVHYGANAALDAAHVEKALRHITSPGRMVVLISLEIFDEALAACVRAARARDALVVVNPAPFRPLGPAILSGIDLLVPNETEAQGFDPEITADDPSDLVRRLRAVLGDRMALVVTLAARGCLVAEPGGAVTALPAPRATVVNTAGAGDAFCGTLAAALAHGVPLVAAAREACRVGAMAVGTPTARLGSGPRAGGSGGDHERRRMPHAGPVDQLHL
jgi:ribokinase